jgi:hypothetical protein
VLSEHSVTVEWRKLFREGNLTADLIQQAERLLEQLPNTSPLRVRLGEELTELTSLAESQREANG